jgi:hypothetical protein
VVYCPCSAEKYIKRIKESLRSIKFYMGFFRHEQESLNNDGRSSLSQLPLPEALFNATCIRLSLGRLLPSRAYLRFIGHFFITLNCILAKRGLTGQ